MRILLVKPRWFVKGGVYRFLTRITFAPLNLGILAALSPGHQVRVVDQDLEDVPPGGGFDLVGLTVTTFTSRRAFDLADGFRERGARVVMGGVHASLMPDECLRHADAVVVGEAEYIWPRVLEDAAAGAMGGVYRQESPTDMDDVPFPRRDLLREDPLVGVIQATRGCVNSCSFCYLPSVPWRAHRRRSPALVFEEMKGIRQEIVFFVDDNLFADEEYAVELCERIAPLGKAWSVQAPTTVAMNRRLLKAMRKSGCFFVQVGFQAVRPDSLREAGVIQNKIEEYREVVRRLHDHGILVQGFFIFGFDSDDRRVFRAAETCIRRIGIEDALLYILTPYPGTPIYERFRREGRLLDRGRECYGWANAVFRPARMTPEELERGVQELYDRLFPFFRRRAPRQILKWLPFFARHPRLLGIVWHALNQRVTILPAAPGEGARAPA